MPMAAPISEYELHSATALEGAHEGEYESEEFFRRLAALASRAASSPALRRLAAAGARAALSGGLGNMASSLLSESEAEGAYTGELEWESEAELNPIRRVYPDALMEHLGHAAAEAESEAEAEAFIGALIPLAARLLPRVAPAIMRAAPGLIRGAAGVARTLRRSPATRPLVRTIPTIVR